MRIRGTSRAFASVGQRCTRPPLYKATQVDQFTSLTYGGAARRRRSRRPRDSGCCRRWTRCSGANRCAASPNIENRCLHSEDQPSRSAFDVLTSILDEGRTVTKDELPEVVWPIWVHLGFHWNFQSAISIQG